MQLEKLNDIELKAFIQDFLRLSDIDFRMRHNLTKVDVERELDDNESLAERFDQLMESVFDQKLRRDCSLTISKLMEELKTDSDLDVNEKRITQQTLQTLIMIKKGFGIKKSSDGGSFASIMEELSE